MIGETLNDVTFKYLYVKNFKWLDMVRAEGYQGHPRVGEVYRAIHGTNTDNYKLVISPSLTLLTDQLVITKEEETYCVSDLIEITKQNIIELNLDEKQLDRLAAWMANDNQDLKKMYGPVQPIPQMNIQQGLISLKNAMAAQEDEEAKAMGKAERVMGGLYVTNSTAFNLVLEIADGLYQYDLLRQASPTLPLTLGTEGKGINCHQALENIHEYLSPVKQGGDERISIKQALLHLFTELERREINNLD